MNMDSSAPFVAGAFDAVAPEMTEAEKTEAILLCNGVMALMGSFSAERRADASACLVESLAAVERFGSADMLARYARSRAVFREMAEAEAAREETARADFDKLLRETLGPDADRLLGPPPGEGN